MRKGITVIAMVILLAGCSVKGQLKKECEEKPGRKFHTCMGNVSEGVVGGWYCCLEKLPPKAKTK